MNAFLFRDGRVCEDCLGSVVPWRGVVHSCYRGRSQSGVVATANAVHHVAGTWREHVDRFIAVSEFQASRLSASVPSEKVVVRPNFLDPDPGAGAGGGGFALFVGRLSPEKGIQPLADHWRREVESLPLKIVGEGPEKAALEDLAEDCPLLEVLGQREAADVVELLGRAEVVVFPSLWYEGFPRVLVESLARGTPVVAYDLGTQGDVVKRSGCGLVVAPGEPDALARAAVRLASDTRMRATMGKAGRATFCAEHTAKIAYGRLMSIYESARPS